MPNFQIPVFPLSERVTFEQLLPFLDTVCNTAAPIFLLEPCEDHRVRPTDVLETSDRPERLVIFTRDQDFREATMKALDAVKLREPKIENQKKRVMSIKGNTPVKAIYRQMAEIPVTVFSMTIDNMDGATLFFLRTAFTISETQKELRAIVIGEGSS